MIERPFSAVCLMASASSGQSPQEPRPYAGSPNEVITGRQWLSEQSVMSLRDEIDPRHGQRYEALYVNLIQDELQKREAFRTYEIAKKEDAV